MKRLAAAVGAVLAAALLAWLAYRAYAPGDLSERMSRAQTRWSPFFGVGAWRFLARGLLVTLRLALVSIALSMVFAVGLALLRLTATRQLRSQSISAAIVRRPAGWLVEIVRSSPLFMLIIYVFIAVPRLGVNLSPFWAGVTALTLYTSCVLSEIVRAGILSLERGQFEAAESLGLSYWQRLRFVVLSQALRRMVPAIVSQLVTLVKDTSLVSFITAVELTKGAQILSQRDANPIETYLVVMAIYFVINFALSELARRLEARPGLGGARVTVAIGEEDQVPVQSSR